MSANGALFEAVDKFYADKRNFMELYGVLHHSKPRKRYRGKMAKIMRQQRPVRLSLKLIHYAVTEFMRGKSTLVLVEGRPVSITSVYAAGIACHGRQNYDAFRRCNSFLYEKHGLVVKTALAQLVFFRDLIRYGVLSYIKDNAKEIDADMRQIKPISDKSSNVVIVKFDTPIKMN